MQLENFIKPKTLSQNTAIGIGIALTLISFFDVALLSFFDVNLTGSSSGASFFVPLVIGFAGLFYIRFEHTNITWINTISL